MPGYRIIGINHDDLADGSGKAGLTFETTNDVLYKHILNDTKTNVGGWRSSKLRARLNSGDLWGAPAGRAPVQGEGRHEDDGQRGRR